MDIGKITATAALLIGTTAAAQAPSTEDGATQHTIWAGFADDLRQSSGISYETDELRTLLISAGVTAADLAWVEAERAYALMAVNGMHVSAENFLLFHPELQLSHKFAADSAALMYGPPRQGEPVDQARDAELWAELKGQLKALEPLRPSASVRDLVWVHVAQGLDEMMFRDSPHTADELLTMPDYRLTRKLVADALADSLTRCVVGGSSGCQRSFDMAMNACDLSRAICEINPLNKRLGVCGNICNRCTCTADCSWNCVCNGGTPAPEGCFSDCEDSSHSCMGGA